MNGGKQMYDLQKMKYTLSKRNEIIDQVRQHIEQLRESAVHYQYATAFDFLGLFSPSLIVDIITGGYKKGRLLKNKPKTNRYHQCFYDKEGNCIYFESYNEFGCSFTTYFLRTEDSVIIAPFIGRSKDEYPSYVYVAYYDESDKIIEYSELTPSSITTENYHYLNKEEAICYRTTYVPKRSSGSLSESKCWLQLKNEKVMKLKYFERCNDKETCTYCYEKESKRRL